MNKGWISLHRKITEHWLYEEERTFSKYEAWIDLLLMANHKEDKLLMDGQLIVVKRGEFITSIRKLCQRWDWSNTKVVGFLDLLEQENMIKVESDTKKTKIILLQYDRYQQMIDKHATAKRNGNEGKAIEKRTNNNGNNVNNDNKYRHAESIGQAFSRYQFGF